MRDDGGLVDDDSNEPFNAGLRMLRVAVAARLAAKAARVVRVLMVGLIGLVALLPLAATLFILVQAVRDR